MKKRHVVFAATLFLTLGTAVAAGSLMYNDNQPAGQQLGESISPDTATVLRSVPLETVEMWKATAMSNDYIAPKAPI
jgi:hypothetical protein